MHPVKFSFKKTNLEMQVNGILLNGEAGSPAKRPYTQQIPEPLGQSIHMLNNYPSHQKRCSFYSYQRTNKSNIMTRPTEINFRVNILLIFYFAK